MTPFYEVPEVRLHLYALTSLWLAEGWEAWEVPGLISGVLRRVGDGSWRLPRGEADLLVREARA